MYEKIAQYLNERDELDFYRAEDVEAYLRDPYNDSWFMPEEKADIDEALERFL